MIRHNIGHPTLHQSTSILYHDLGHEVLILGMWSSTLKSLIIEYACLDFLARGPIWQSMVILFFLNRAAVQLVVV